MNAPILGEEQMITVRDTFSDIQAGDTLVLERAGSTLVLEVEKPSWASHPKVRPAGVGLVCVHRLESDGWVITEQRIP